jgi:hypothetical protein
VQGVEGPERELWDAGEIVGHLVSAGSMFAFLAEHRGQLFPDEDYADLFTAGVGRPSWPATRMAAVLTLQALHDLSDRKCAEAVGWDLRWKAACRCWMRASTRRRWCTGGGGSRPRIGRIGSTTRSGG